MPSWFKFRKKRNDVERSEETALEQVKAAEVSLYTTTNPRATFISLLLLFVFFASGFGLCFPTCGMQGCHRTQG